MLTLMDDIPGFVCGYRFDPESGSATPLSQRCGRHDLVPEGGFVWLHLALSDARVPSFLASLDRFSGPALETLVDRDNHVQLGLDEGTLYGVLTDLERAFDYDTRDIGWFRFAIDGGLIVTARLHPLRCIEATRTAVARGQPMRRPMDVLEHIVAEFEKTVDQLTTEMGDELDRIEDYVFEDMPRDERRRLGPVRRTAVRLQRQLRASVGMFRRIRSLGDGLPKPHGLDEATDRILDLLSPVLQDIQGLTERARLLHEEIDSKISAETNRHLYILSVMTAFLLPPTLVTGFFGMNTGGLPFADGLHGTVYAFLFGAASVGGAWWLLRRAGIL